MPKLKPSKERQLVVANPGHVPGEFPVLEYADGLKFHEGDTWERPERTTAEIEQSLIDRGYLVEVSDG